MTDLEKAIVMAYTGCTMLAGDKLGIYYKYVQEKLGRSVMTHELAYQEVQDAIKEAAKKDFIAIAKADNGWVSVKDRLPEDESDVLVVKQIKNGKRKIQLARCIPEFEDYETGEKGYWECVGDNKVLFWMPLPKIPKEDT